MLMEIRHRRAETILPNLTLNQLLARARIECHGVRLHQPDWSNQSHSLAITASAVAANLDVYLMLNAYWEPLRFELPPVGGDESRPCLRCFHTITPPTHHTC